MSLRVTLILVLLLACGCGDPNGASGWGKKDEGPPPTPFLAWAVNDMENLTDLTPRRDDPLIFDYRTQGVSLFAAGNETISLQLVVQAGSAGLEGLQLTWTPLTGPAVIPAAAIKAFRMLPVRVSEYPAWYIRTAERPPQPANFYDALVPIDAPREGQPFSVPANERIAFWIDITVPRTAAAGEYAGRLGVVARNQPAWNTPVKLQVYDLVLPDSRPLAAIGGFDHEQIFAAMVQRDGLPYVPAVMDRANPLVNRGLTIMRDLMRQAHEHRLDLFDKQLRPQMKRDPAGAIQLDWDDYDAIARPYLDGNAFDDRLPVPAWPSPLSEAWPDARNYTDGSAQSFAATVRDLAAATRSHMQEIKGECGIFCWPSRGEPSPGQYDRFMEIARAIRQGDPEAAMLTALPTQPPAQAGWKVPADFAATATIFAPPGQWFDGRLARRHAGGETILGGVWLTPDCPPYSPSMSLIATPADVRAIPWLAAKYGCRGIFMPEVLNWGGDPFAPGASQIRLFYPGTRAGLDGVLPSVRLKRLRRGLQDATYLAVLQQRQQEQTALNLIDAMVHYGGLAATGDHYLDARLDGWVQGGAVWYNARRLLADEARQAVNPSEQSFEELLTRRIAWKDINDAARTIRLEQARTAVTAAKLSGGGEGLAVEVRLDLYNEYDREANVTVHVNGLPPQWQGPADDIVLEAMPAALPRTASVSVSGPLPQNTAAGKIPLRLSIAGGVSPATTAIVQVPLLQSSPTGRAPKIDGDLADWTARSGGVAGDFQLIGHRGTIGHGLAERQTQAWVQHDRDNLYIALRCSEHNMAGVVSRSDNLVRYQQLLACQEDLVEVLLDPGQAAKSMGDVYHIVIKPGGAVVSERGIRTEMPMGTWQPWASGIQAAVGRGEGEWLVELAIPRSSLGPLGKERVWGVNFTRFAAQGGEASSWAPAARYFYDPRNLGTMFLSDSAASAASTTTTQGEKP